MRVITALLVLTLAGLATPQFFRFRRPNRFRGRPRPQFNGPPQQNVQGNRGGFFYSWEALGRNAEFTWGQANQQCRRRGMNLVSLNGQKESIILNKIGGDNVKYIWTSGRGQAGRGFTWGNGQRVNSNAWSNTGLEGRAQPDNREGNENCLAVLNNFYNDGIRYHDVACHHRKPFVCE